MRLRQLIGALVILLSGTGFGLMLGSHVWQRRSSSIDNTSKIGSASSISSGSADKRSVLYWANPMNPSVHADHPMKDGMGMAYVPVYASAGPENKTSDLHIDPRMAQTLGVRLATAQMRPMGHVVHSVGTVTVDENRTYTITSRFTGWIKQLKVRAVGEKIHRGEILAEVYSPQIFSAQQEYLIAGHEAGAAGGSALLEATRERLRRFGMPRSSLATLERTGRPLRDIPIVSPENGVVTALKIRQGGYVSSGTDLYEIANLDRVWVKVALYSYQLPWVKIGNAVNLNSPDYPGKIWKGRLKFLYPTLDSKTRTVSARVSIANPGDVLRPGMYANATLFAGSQPALAVPSSAVLQTDNGDYAMLSQKQGHFLPVELALGPEADGWTAVTNGLKIGEEVVDNAQFLLYSASQFQNVKARMLGGNSAAKPAVSALATNHFAANKSKQGVGANGGSMTGMNMPMTGAAP
jgi:Cu(I)/Ag(I) efflux system membrane fusion protein